MDTSKDGFFGNSHHFLAKRSAFIVEKGSFIFRRMKLWFLFPIWVGLLACFFYKTKDQEDTVVPAIPEVVHIGEIEREIETVAPPKVEVVAPSVRVSLEAVDQVQMEERVAELLDELSLMPVDPEADPVSFLWPLDVDGPALPELMEIARMDSFIRWKPYEDEWVSFYYPDHVDITLDVVDGAASFPMIGETMWTVREHPFRRYILRSKGGTFCAISLEKTTVFDDTERFPGEEVYQRFFHFHGALGRASMMADGQVRRIQFVGSDVRVSVHDWPHLAIHQDVYKTLGLGIIINRPPVDAGKLDAAVLRYYGFEGGLGLLEKGMSLAEMEMLLGDPTGLTGELAVYHRGQDESDRYYRLRIEDGILGGFAEDWYETNVNPPMEGSVEWILEKTEISAGSTGGSKGYSLGALSDADVTFIFDSFCSKGPSASPDEWEKMTRALANLAEMKYKDERVLPIIRRRFLEENLPMSHSIQVLHAWDRDGSRDDFAGRIGKIVQMSLRGKKEEMDRAGPLNADLQVLIAYLGEDDERTAKLILQAMGHRMPEVRSVAFSYWSWIKDEAKQSAQLIHGLSDQSPKVRRRCAEAFCDECGTLPEHGMMLEACLIKERDSETRNYLALALERLRKSATLKVEAHSGSDS